MNEYTILVMDQSMGRAFTTTITKPDTADFEKNLFDKLETMGFRLKDCDWMEFDDEIEHLN